MWDTKHSEHDTNAIYTQEDYAREIYSSFPGSPEDESVKDFPMDPTTFDSREWESVTQPHDELDPEVSVLDRLELVFSDREEAYDGSAKTLKDIATMWSAYLTTRLGILEVELSSSEVAQMMVLFKIARGGRKFGDQAFDDAIDTAGYAVIAAELRGQ